MKTVFWPKTGKVGTSPGHVRDMSRTSATKRTEPCPIADLDKSPLDEIIYNASHTGREFDTDNKEVHRILDEFTLVIDVADWMKTYLRHHYGRAAWIILCEHYNCVTCQYKLGLLQE